MVVSRQSAGVRRDAKSSRPSLKTEKEGGMIRGQRDGPVVAKGTNVAASLVAGEVMCAFVYSKTSLYRSAR
jgi:hypothetical protein